MTRSALLLPVAALLLACAGSGEPDPSTDDDFSLPPASDALVPTPSKGIVPGERSVTGVLGFDDIEGGCATLQTPEGVYEVIYPQGWHIDRATGELRGPAGEVVHPGETVTVNGSIDPTMASTCQVGQIFVATEVTIPGS